MTSVKPLPKMICVVRRKKSLRFVILLYKTHGDVMVSTGVLKVGIAIRSPVNCVIKPETFLKRNDNNKLAYAA